MQKHWGPVSAAVPRLGYSSTWYDAGFFPAKMSSSKSQINIPFAVFSVSSSINRKQEFDPWASSLFPVALGLLSGELKQALLLTLTHTLDITPYETKEKTTSCETQAGA